MVTRCIERSVCDDASVWPVLPPMSFAALRSCSDRRERESLPGHLVAGVFYAGLAAAASPAGLPSLSSAVPVDGRGMTGDPPIANSVNSTAIDGCHNNPFAGLAGRLLAAAGGARSEDSIDHPLQASPAAAVRGLLSSGLQDGA